MKTEVETGSLGMMVEIIRSCHNHDMRADLSVGDPARVELHLPGQHPRHAAGQPPVLTRGGGMRAVSWVQIL